MGTSLLKSSFGSPSELTLDAEPSPPRQFFSVFLPLLTSAMSTGVTHSDNSTLKHRLAHSVNASDLQTAKQTDNPINGTQKNNTLSQVARESGDRVASTETDTVEVEKQKKVKKPRKRSRLNVAPLNTPLHRRLQTLAVIWHTVSIPSFCILFLLVVYLGSVSWVSIILPYFVWFYGVDLHTPTNGKVVYRVRGWMKNLILWEWFVDYFPIKVYKLCDLEPTFTYELVESESVPDDEDDLVSEYSRTTLDSIFKWLGLLKRINDSDRSSPPATGSDNEDDKSSKDMTHTYRKVSTGPRYIFGYHPHGVISMGVMGLFGTNALRNEPFRPPLRMLKKLFHDPSKGKRLFPGIGYIFPLTLTTQFTIPFFRDYLLSLGLTSAGAKNIKSIINNGDNSVCIVVGGAQESLLNAMVGDDIKVGMGYQGHSDSEDEHVEEKPKRQIRLVLKNRKGFVKLALELGNVSLVPTFAFGEADIYKLTMPEPGSIGHYFQQWVKKNFQFTIPFFSARGVFIYDFGMLPYRTPINIVTGRPVYVPSGLLLEQKEEPTEKPLERSKRLSSITSLLSLGSKKKKPARRQIPPDLLNHYHKLYIEELQRVYDENKHKFGYGDVELIITD